MDASPDQTRYVVGVMTGTSIDAVDAALVRIEGQGLAMRGRLVGHRSRSLHDLGPGLRAAAEQSPMTAAAFASLAWEFGEYHALVIGDLVREYRCPPDFVCVHGQTVFHHPPISWQLMNPAPIAARLKCPVVSDLRQADLAAGGQGAPITPLADWILFRVENKRRAIVNLGGFCNVTILPADSSRGVSPVVAPELRDIRGFDVCACNQVLDAVAREAFHEPFDSDGDRAQRGRAIPQAADSLLNMLQRQRAGGRSLGTGDEATQWVKDQLCGGIGDDDLAATAVDAVAKCIGSAIHEHRADELIVAGGGARNAALVEALATAAGMAVRLCNDLGVPIEARESMAFAILGTLCADGVPITLPQVTGCRTPAPISGTWHGTFPGKAGG